MAAPALALDFKFGSEYRIRFYSGSNVGFTDFPGTNPRGAQIRIRPRFDTSDDNGNITATLRLEIGDIEWGNGGGASGVTNFQPAAAGANNVGPGGARVGNGAGGSIGNDGVNVETKWAWIDAAMPFGIPLRVRAGLQPWFESKGLVIDDDTVGVRAYGQVKPISYEFAWYRVSGGVLTTAVPAGAAGQSATSNTIDNNYDFYGFKVNAALAPFLNPGVYYYFGMNKATAVGTPATSHYVGFTATGKAGIVSYDLDFVYGTAEGGPTGSILGASDFQKVKGWALDGGVHFPLGPVTLNFVGSASTGDKRDGGDSEAFPTIAPSWNGPGGLFQIIGSGGPFDAVEFTQDAPTNLWTIGATVDYRPVKRLLTTFGVAYAGFYTKKGNCANTAAPLTAAALCHGPSYTRLSDAATASPATATSGNGSAKGSLGTEFFIRADYDVWTGFKVMTQVGWLIPSAGDTAGEYVLQLLYSF
jgi:hypothetical protein